MKLNRERRVMVGVCCLVALAVALVGSGKIELHKVTKTHAPVVMAHPDVVPEWSARLGSPAAMMEMSGNLFSYGRVAQDEKALKAAMALWRCAAARGDARAQLLVASLYGEGGILPKDEAQAVRWYRKAAEQGLAEAQFYLGVCYDFGKGVPQSSREAVRWYRAAAEQGQANAQYNLACCYEEGEGVEQDAATARVWYGKAAAQGHEEARAALEQLGN